MQRFLKVFFLTCAFAAVVVAQPDKYTVPVRWERYRAPEKSVSALFPKMPVALPDASKACFGEESAQYVAYADETVFTLRVTSKTKPYEYCSEKRNFSERNFKERLKQLGDIEEGKKEAPTSTPAPSAAFDRATAKFVGKYWIRLLFNDARNERWFELYVASRDLSKPAVNNFLESFKIGQQTDGIEIGKGAPANFGDASETVEQQPAAEQKPAAKPNSAIVKGDGLGNGDATGGASPNANAGDGQNKNVISEPIIIVFKPRANYTDAARQSNIQGTVRLRVTFLANGGIGSLSVISALPLGLTEEALAAARKLFFLPARRNGVKHSLTKVVEYQFSLY